MILSYYFKYKLNDIVDIYDYEFRKRYIPIRTKLHETAYNTPNFRELKLLTTLQEEDSASLNTVCQGLIILHTIYIYMAILAASSTKE